MRYAVIGINLTWQAVIIVNFTGQALLSGAFCKMWNNIIFFKFIPRRPC